MGDYAIKKKMNVKWGSQKRGDIVLFDFNNNGTSDHIGIVVSVNKDGSITTVEGNTGSGSDTNGGQVLKRTRYKSSVNYFVRPKYTKEVTADMVVATALAEVGVKESPRNSNKVKYNVWFYGKNQSAYWCCTFVCWVFAHVREDVVAVTKPTGKYDGVIASATLKNGSKGENAKNLQKFLNWYHPAWKLTEDGEFGSKTEYALKCFQKTEDIGVDGVYGNNSYKHANAYKASSPTPTPTPTKKGYTGTFPSLNNNQKIVNSMAYRMCYPYGTAQKKYKYSSGKPTAAYKAGIDKIYPNHKSWSSARQRVGACCDVFVGVCLGYVGIKVKKDLKDQLKDMPKMSSLKSNGHCKAGDFRLGDVVQRGRKDYSGHTWVVCELVNGKRYVANSHYKKLKGCYAVMDAKPATIVPSKWKYYKCYTVQGAIRTDHRKGDYGYDVLYIQKFLNWYGIKCTADGDFGAKTEDAVKKFQTAQKLTVDGEVGAKTIAKMKEVRK